MSTPATQQGEEFRGTKRFLVLRRLGAGGAGVVYEAYDREQGGRVALKLLKKLHADALLRFKNEFRALQDLHHPNLVSLGEFFEQDGQWFFTMEYIDGIDLLSYVNRFGLRRGSETTEDRTIVDAVEPPRAPAAAPGSQEAAGESKPVDLCWLPPFDEKKLRAVMPQLVRGVRALHAAGKIHRDIKASNILVTADGRLVLLDFGLIMETRRAREEAETHLVVGTEKYMAPEQAAALAIGPQADCYSIGVVLYRALTGQFPFGEATGDALIMKQRHRPPQPLDVIEGVPEDLNKLCVDLLRLSPDLRPTCDHILERLNVLDAKGAGTSNDSLSPGALTAQAGSAAFVGRDVELAILRDAFDEALRGGTCAIAVLGESGVGKSTLTRKFAELISDETGAVVLSSRCYERESVPYKAVDGIIDTLARVLARMPAMDLEDVMPERAALLAQAFPVLRRVRQFADAAPLSEAVGVDPKERRVQLFGAVRDLLGNLAARLPVVLVIDDLQWSDADSLALLRELLRGPDAPAILLLATARAAGAVVPETMLAALGDVRTLRLDRLDPDDARELARKLLERVPWSSEETALRIAREANGHPLFIDELVRHALQGGEEQAKTARLEDALTARIDRLDHAQRQVLDAVAVAGGPLRMDVAAHATSIDLAVLARAASQLRIANLMRASGVRRVDVIESYHDRVRDTVLALLGDDARRTWHRRIAMAIEALLPGDADGLVTHWRGAQDPEKAARYALIAAAHASDALAFDRAARLYKLALALDVSTPEDVRSIRTNLAMALVNAGRGADAAEAFLAASQGASDDDAIDLQRRAAEQLLFAGHFDEGISVLRGVLTAMGMEVARTNRSALASLLVRRGQLRLRGLEFKERLESECAQEDLRRIDLLAAVSGSLGMVDTIRGADFQTRHALLALKTGEPNRIIRALALEAAYSATSGTKSAVRTATIVARARELAARFPDDPLPQGWSLSGAGVSAFLEGRWKDAYDVFTQAGTIFRERCAGQAWAVDQANFYSLGALVHLGELRDLGRRIPKLLEEATQRGDRYAMTQLRTGVLSIAWLARGDSTVARREADDAITHWSSQGTHLPHFLDVLAQAQIDLYEGHPRAAYARVCDKWEALSKAFLLRVQFIRIKMLELRGRAAIAVGVASNSMEHLREAVKCASDIESEGTKWGAPLAKVLRAAVIAAAGDPGQAADLLQAAELEFLGERMALHVAIARWRRSELAAEEESKLLRASATSWMQDQAIADMERMAQTIAPWKRVGETRRG